MIKLNAILTNDSVELITQRSNYIAFYWTCEEEIFLVRILFDTDAQLSLSRKSTKEQIYQISEKKLKQLKQLCFGNYQYFKQFKGDNGIYLQTMPSPLKRNNILEFR